MKINKKNIIKYLTQYKIKSKSRKRKDILKEMRKICKLFEIRIIMRKFKTADGSVGYDWRTILLDSTPMHNNKFISAFLHELIHIYAYRNKIFKGLHSRKHYVDRCLLQQAWKAEYWVDLNASIVMKKLYPKYKYCRSYLNRKKDKKQILDYYKN